jgi:hypothetical protein
MSKICYNGSGCKKTEGMKSNPLSDRTKQSEKENLHPRTSPLLFFAPLLGNVLSFGYWSKVYSRYKPFLNIFCLAVLFSSCSFNSRTFALSFGSVVLLLGFWILLSVITARNLTWEQRLERSFWEHMLNPIKYLSRYLKKHTNND